jgi:hypothetical protein
MPWVRVDDGLFLHPKWLATPAGARALWVTALSYCGNQANGGIVPAVLLPMLGATVDDAEALVKSGLWTRDGDGYQINQFSDYNPTSTPDAAADRALARSKSAQKAGMASAAKRQREANVESTTDQRSFNDRSTNVQRATNERSTSGQRNSTPIPSPSPSPTYTDRLDGDLQRARETAGINQQQTRPQPLIRRAPVRTMDNEIDRPAPAKRESEPEARARRAIELSRQLYDAEDDAELERINQWYRDRDAKQIDAGEPK